MAKNLQAIVEIAGAISPSVGKSINEVTNKLGGINVKAIAVGAGVAAMGVAVVAGVAKATKAVYELGEQFQEAENAIRVGTGATGEALEELMGNFDKVYSSVPTTMGDASQAISDWNTRLGVTGDALEILSTQALQVSDLMGEDLTGTIEASSQAFKQWNIDANSMGGEMDYIFKVCQSTGMGFSDLMSHMQSSGAVLQTLGYNFDEAAAMIANLDKAGINTEQVLKGMKKGLGNIAKDGGDAVAAMNEYADAISNAKSESEAITIATEIFGSATAVTMAQAIRTGAMDVEAFTKSLQENGETIGIAAEDTYTLAEKFQMFRQKAEVALEPLASTLLDSVESMLPVVTDLMDQLIPVIGQLAQAIIPIIQNLIPKILPLITQLVPPILEIAGVLANDVIPPIIEMVTALLPVALQIISALMPIIRTIAATVMPILVRVFEAIIPPVTTLIETLLPVLQQIFEILCPVIDQLFVALSPILDAFMSLITALLPPLISILEALMPVINVVATVITTVLMVAIQALMPAIEGVIGVVSGLAGVFQAAFSGLVGIVKTPINAIIALVNKAIGAINNISIDVPDWVPLLGGKHFGFSIPTIPMLAKGGFTDGVSIAGEKGQEAVISFDKAYRSDNIGYWEKAGEMLGVYNSTASLAGELLSVDGFSLSGLASDNSTTIYDFSGMSYSPTVNTQESPKGIMEQLEEAGNDFIDWLESWIRRKDDTAYA